MPMSPVGYWASLPSHSSERGSFAAFGVGALGCAELAWQAPCHSAGHGALRLGVVLFVSLPAPA
jgi:hypothetical protein